MSLCRQPSRIGYLGVYCICGIKSAGVTLRRQTNMAAAVDVFNLYQAIHIRPISNPYPDDIHIQCHIGQPPATEQIVTLLSQHVPSVTTVIKTSVLYYLCPVLNLPKKSTQIGYKKPACASPPVIKTTTVLAAAALLCRTSFSPVLNPPKSTKI